MDSCALNVLVKNVHNNIISSRQVLETTEVSTPVESANILWYAHTMEYITSMKINNCI